MPTSKWVSFTQKNYPTNSNYTTDEYLFTLHNVQYMGAPSKGQEQRLNPIPKSLTGGIKSTQA
jgi:hypothetical protein